MMDLKFCTEAREIGVAVMNGVVMVANLNRAHGTGVRTGAPRTTSEASSREIAWAARLDEQLRAMLPQMLPRL
jgi:hypothetical protein